MLQCARRTTDQSEAVFDALGGREIEQRAWAVPEIILDTYEKKGGL